MDVPEELSNTLIHFVGRWTKAETENVRAFIQDIERITIPGTHILPGAKPWTMICHDSLDPAIYLASRIGIPGVFRAHTSIGLITIIQSFIDDMRRNE